MKRCLLLLVLLGLWAEGPVQAQEGATVIYLVRHAEKADDGTSDPPLTAEGEARAAALAQMLRDTGVTHLHSSDYQRTRQTAAPLAELLGQEVTIYNARDLRGFAETLRQTPGVHLVSGHSNTTPALVELLGGDPHSSITEYEYDRLYILVLSPDGPVTTALLRLSP